MKHIKDEKHRHLMFYVLKSNSLLFNVLNNIPIDVKGFDEIPNKQLIYNRIKTIIRKYKTIIPYSNKLSMQLDESMYKYKNGYIYIMSNVKGKRLKLKVNTNVEFKGNIRVNINKNTITISKAIDTKHKNINFLSDSIGIDKNFINCIDTNTENSYGINFNKQITIFSDSLQEQNTKRQYYKSKVYKLRNLDNPTAKDKLKIENIIKYNLGDVKYNKKKNRLKENLRKLINKSINETINTEKPKEIVIENLNFTSKRKKYNKRTNRLLNTWFKGELNNRIKYKTTQYNINLIEVNAAYTSQECSLCHHIGEKRKDIFYCSNSNCMNNKGVHSGHEAAKVILQRKSDHNIKLFHTPYIVKNILQKRMVELKTESS